ncbi:MAG: hypothetical protein C0469_07520 [Cyanobacteria bacterium DS2.3.42]|nr:hypothetical protein [Cyanobacteria bacterium DS2.3.42]
MAQWIAVRFPWRWQCGFENPKIKSDADRRKIAPISIFLWQYFFAYENVHEMFHWLAESATLSSKIHQAAPIRDPTTISSGKKFALAA